MKTRMLIDALHREETRVAVVTGNKIEEFDFESEEHKQLKGNIYLAKVTRVEPSLQAAFVDYGGNRHGFLAFSEIHPDYYQIPKEDRERLLAEEAEAAAEEASMREQEEMEEAGEVSPSYEDEDEDELIEIESDERVDTIDINEGETGDSDDDGDDEDDASQDDEASHSENGSHQDEDDVNSEDGSDEDGVDGENRQNRSRRGRGRGRGGRRGNNNRENGQKGGRQNGRGNGRSAPKASDEMRAKRIAIRRRYKIQDVIQRRQVLLVQVVKEERGNKGAALTTYLSLAGRYCVLMPNTSHGGGISRKISNSSDRKRLKSIVSEMKLPSTMGCIIRTAGMSRTKVEIKRDFTYLARLWDEVREKTLKGAAPTLIHSDSDLIKRAIRDIYNRDIDEVLVEGEDSFKVARNFMKLLMPSHARKVQLYSDATPLFQVHGVEDQLNAMYQPVVQLKSGGYIVINPTEALVSIDINSGRSTKEHGIEATALSTNLEAAREIARQLRLRDMAGLVVIDFIDMEHHSNNRKVERAMKDALKNDRARIQVGRISSFGLMEMSRQRLRTGVLEASTRECPHCEGTGLVRTASSSALSALRMVEDEAAQGKGSIISLSASQEAAIYVLNNKRHELANIEDRFGVRISVTPNGEVEGAKMTVSSSGPPSTRRPIAKAPIVEEFDDEEEVEAENNQRSEGGHRHDDQDDRGNDQNGEPRKKRRRRGRRGGRDRNNDAQQDRNGHDDAGSNQAEQAQSGDNLAANNDEQSQKPRRSRRRKNANEDANNDGRNNQEHGNDAAGKEVQANDGSSDDENGAAKPKARRKPSAARAKKVKEEAVSTNEDTAESKPKTRRASTAKKKAETAAKEAATDAATNSASAISDNGEEAGDKPAAKKPARTRKKAEPKAKATKTADSNDVSEKAAKPKASAAAKKPATRKKAAPKTTGKAADKDAEKTVKPAKAAKAEKAEKPKKAAEKKVETEEADSAANTEEKGPRKGGWWQRTFG
ncbi:ribonuclease E/G [Sphingorhabdus lutea]|uniref:Ribonuclease E n=1 Tax=Sphingorhabdus lutea TaxID=1913578 RepID=A0A1L3JES1_9SPHN|nr:Rne/Rng family ribonuclease [Sphingorhabdus lutea]APG63635.1 ribonuclease E/G [Sphingorhabdus lutea]